MVHLMGAGGWGGGGEKGALNLNPKLGPKPHKAPEGLFQSQRSHLLLGEELPQKVCSKANVPICCWAKICAEISASFLSSGT